MVATPYSLKASDAETLAGHPLSDFTLKNSAHPAGGTNITQINVGNGVTGGGTGPTVTLGLSSSYLETLGNGIYPQLAGANNLTGTNTFTAGRLLLGTSPVLSASAVTATSPVTATVSGNTVKIGLSDSALLTLGNGVYAQLTAANTFTNAQTFSVPVTFAASQNFPGVPTLSGTDTFTGLITINGTAASGEYAPSLLSQLTVNDTSTSSTAIPLAVQGTTSIGFGVEGNGAIGVYGFGSTPATGSYVSYGVEGYGANVGGIFYAPDGGTASGAVNGYAVEAIGYIGISAFGDSAAGTAVNGDAYFGVVGRGVFIGTSGQTGDESATGTAYPNYVNGIGTTGDSSLFGGVGMLATADDGYGALVANNSTTGYNTLEVDDNSTESNIFGGYNIPNGAQCFIDAIADLTCSGSTASINSVGERMVKTYGVQSAENWIEDFGSGQLSSGSSHISLEPTFAATVNTGAEYHVFLTPRGDSEGLYVANAGPDGFDVKESRSGHSSIAFDYRIVAKRKGLENVRMEDITAKIAAQKARHDKMFKPGADAAKRPKPSTIHRYPRVNPLVNPTRATPDTRAAIEPQKQ